MTKQGATSNNYKMFKDNKKLNDDNEYEDDSTTTTKTSFIEGIVLDRRSKYLDVCIQSADAISIDYNNDYRLDCFVNRVSYDRMLTSLQLLLSRTEEMRNCCFASIPSMMTSFILTVVVIVER